MLDRIKNSLLLLFIISCSLSIFSQEPVVSDGRYALPENVTPRAERFLGFPDEKYGEYLLEHFKNPPKGYGEVPFYWWTGGDPLTKERLLWQLNQLSNAGVIGFSVSYNHTHKIIDSSLNKNTGILFGVPEASDPPFMSEKWWDIWNWFSAECGQRNMGLGLDDYVVGRREAGYWEDRVYATLGMQKYQGHLKVHQPVTVKKGEKLEMAVSESTLTAMAYPKEGEGYNGDRGIDLLPLVKNNVVEWEAPADSQWEVIIISTEKGFMIHPDHGKTLIKEYYQQFEDRLSPEGRKGMNFFFQDELEVDIDNQVWSEDFVSFFEDKKGYDIRNLLPALYYDLGAITPKIRLDYHDVMIELAEKRYFKPIFEWHWQRGLIMGCDNVGRGLHPEEYGDYFRATRWFGAPGNDAPRSGYSFIQTKVSSSIAHLYKRPRVWLEAYHSIGWNAQPSHIDFLTNKHFQFGANLLCLHGLYYTTHGGWWEWAPPDFHFRMPYWPHFKHWLKNAERLSFLLSQGVHVCDVAIMYPVAPLQAKNGGDQEQAFNTGKILFNQGIDFDFLDFQSLNRTKISEGRIHISDENYQALVLADMSAIHYSTLEKALDLFLDGGIIIGVGLLPVASDRIGGADPKIDEILSTIFGYTASEVRNLKEPVVHSGSGTGIYYPSADTNLGAFISPYLERDFIPENLKGSVLHRQIDDHDLYMVMDIKEGTSCFFRATGKPKLLNLVTGSTRDLKIIRQANAGTHLHLPMGVDQANLIMFSPGQAEFEKEESKTTDPLVMTIEGAWESELVPTLDNRWGDFRLPATPDTIGAEARYFKYKIADEQLKEYSGKNCNDEGWPTITCSFGPKMWRLHLPDKKAQEVLQQVIDGKEIIQDGDKLYHWESYDYSLRKGVENSPGSQGYHGLKHKVSDDFLIMGEEGSYYFKTHVYSMKKSNVDVIVSGRKPNVILINGKKVRTDQLTLTKGFNTLILFYGNVKKGDVVENSTVLDTRTRSAVVLMKQGNEMKPTEPLSMKWYQQPGIKTYDVYPGKTKTGYYRFEAPPGLKSMQLKVYGTINAYSNGNKLDVKTDKMYNDGLQDCSIIIRDVKKEMSTICFEVEHQPGYYGGSIFPDPVKLNCEKGIIKSGDWSEMGALKAYSGGMWYRKNIQLKKEQITNDIYLDLGEVCATAEVHINGKQAGICLARPFKLNIKDYVKEGGNYVEILVYSTLSNHYSTIPTPERYKQSFNAGLIGPVRILWKR